MGLLSCVLSSNRDLAEIKPRSLHYAGRRSQRPSARKSRPASVGMTRTKRTEREKCAKVNAPAPTLAKTGTGVQCPTLASSVLPKGDAACLPVAGGLRPYIIGEPRFQLFTGILAGLASVNFRWLCAGTLMSFSALADSVSPASLAGALPERLIGSVASL